MCDEWMPHLQVRMSWEEYQSLPRHPAYRYEYMQGTMFLTPRARHYHAQLDLADFKVFPARLEGMHLRPMRAADQERLPDLFAWAFDNVQPFGSLTEERRLEAARACLEKTCSGRDGPLVEEASFVAALDENDQPVAGIFITLLPGGDPLHWSCYYWESPPPQDLLFRRAGQPHLTWIFVPPIYARRGLGTVLLADSVQALKNLGYTSLLTTFMAGNTDSALWHWHNGFRLLPHPTSKRPQESKGT